MSYKSYVAAGMLLTAVATTFVRADLPRPLGEGPTAPTTVQNDSSHDASHVATPYWNQDQAGQPSDLPAADIRAVAPAKAQATAARWAFNQTLDDLSLAIRVTQMQFNLRPDVAAAMKEEHAAYDAMQKERARVLAPLDDNAAYVASNQLSSSVSEQIIDERQSDAPNPSRLLGMATVRLNYVQDNRKLETSLLQRDDGYQKARDRYLNAAQKVADLRQAETLAVMTSSDLAALRHQVATARIAKLASAAYLYGALEARDIAIDYAGYYRRTGYLNNSYIGGYGIGAYGAGFQYGVHY